MAMTVVDAIMGTIEKVIHDDFFKPYWGWHDEHAHADRTPNYRPALQQSRDEFRQIVGVVCAAGLLHGRCLQLGVGACSASHEVWGAMFAHVTSVDISPPQVRRGARIIAGDTHDAKVLKAANSVYDFLFIDAGHTYMDVKKDHVDYSPLVRRGGIIAFHDAMPRPGFTPEELGVPEYLKTMQHSLIAVGGIGIAYYVKGLTL